MKFTTMLSAGCLAAAVSASGLLAQDEPVEVRIRAIEKDGEVEVVEERLVGPAEPATKKRKDAAEVGPAEPKAAEAEEGTIRARVFRRLKTAADEALADYPSSDYWIGVQLAPVPPEIRKHMTVKHGVLVQGIHPDSPAEKSALQEDDVLLQAGEARIENPADLIKAVDAAKTSELKFKVLREGKEQTIAITPVKRSEAALTLTRPAVAGTRLERLQEAQKQFEKALEALRAETAEEGTVDFMLVRPGAFLARTAEAKAPDDLTIQITKEGNKPAKINVKKGDKSWDVTADKLDDLPKEIRPFVEQMTSGGASAGVMVSPGDGRFTMKVSPPGKPGVIPPQVVLPFPPGVPSVPALPAVPGTPAAPRMIWSAAVPAGAADAKLDQILKKLETLTSPDLEEMKKELQTLRKEVEDLRSNSK